MVEEHPNVDQLRAFSLGQLDEEAASVAIAQHLESCPDCCRKLQAVPNDTLLTLLQHGETPIDSFLDLGKRNPSLTCGLPASLTEAPAVPAELAQHPRYHIQDLLGVGGMGAVYKAEHLLMERTVALKVINRQLVEKPAAVDRFRREFKAAARLSHPNIVTAFDAEQAGDTNFLVMEYVAGITLAKLVGERGPLSVREACAYIRQAALGLQHAFEHGMVHRDIKPQNLMVTQIPSGGREPPEPEVPDGPSGGLRPPLSQRVVKILDFGLARLASEVEIMEDASSGSRAEGGMTAAGMVLGTADYISPEQANDPRTADIRSDIYSLGCTLYFLLTGRPPFPEGNLMQKLKAHEERLPESVTTLRKDIPPDLARVLERMLAKKPADRFQTPAEVARALSPFAGTDGASLMPVTRSTPAPRRRRIRPLVALVAALLLLTVGLLVFGVYRIATDYGEFVVEVNDKDVEALLTKNGVTIHDRTTGRKYQLKPGRHDLKTGRYEIDVTELPEGLELSTREFTIKRGGEAKIKVSLQPTAPAQLALQMRERAKLEGHEGTIYGLAFSQDGKTLVSASTGNLVGAKSPGQVMLWDVATGKMRRTLAGLTDVVYGAAVSPDGKLVAAGTGEYDEGKKERGVVKLWDAATGKERATLKGEMGWVWSLAFSPDGKTLAFAGNYTDFGKPNEIELWDLATGKKVASFKGRAGQIVTLAFSPDGKTLASGGAVGGLGPPGEVRLWDVATGKELADLKGHTCEVSAVAFSPDGKLLASAARSHFDGFKSGEVKLWDVATSKELATRKGEHTGAWCLAFAPDGTTLAMGMEKMLVKGTEYWTVRLWDTRLQKELAVASGHTGIVTALAFSADGKTLASAGLGGFVKLWELSSARSKPDMDPPSPQKRGEVRLLPGRQAGSLWRRGSNHPYMGC